MNKLSNLSIIDSHVHAKNINDIEELMKVAQICNLSSINILSLSAYGGAKITQNLVCMLAKAMYPGEIYGFGGLHYPGGKIPESPKVFFEQVKKLIEIGFDGIKMIEGKPTVRKKIAEPLDSSIYDEFFNFLEEKQIPIIYHVGDPEEFWNKETIPDFAMSNGWFYGDGSYQELETLYKEAEGILKKFPGLKVIFAHFYFMSKNIQRASEFLDKWPQVSFDITPGGEMYIEFSKSPGKWHDFFVKYQDRILFGTDNLCGDSAENIKEARMFLETDKEFWCPFWGFNVRGICLDNVALEKIYFNNFIRYTGKAPRKLNMELVRDESERIMAMAANSTEKNRSIPMIRSIIEKLKSRKLPPEKW